MSRRPIGTIVVRIKPLEIALVLFTLLMVMTTWLAMPNIKSFINRIIRSIRRHFPRRSSKKPRPIQNSAFLLRLPPEIRMMIYEETFGGPSRFLPVISAVCNTTRRECLPLFLNHVTLKLTISVQCTVKHTWSRKLLRQEPRTEFPVRCEDLHLSLQGHTRRSREITRERPWLFPDSLLATIPYIRQVEFDVKDDEDRSRSVVRIEMPKPFDHNRFPFVIVEPRTKARIRGEYPFADTLRHALTSIIFAEINTGRRGQAREKLDWALLHRVCCHITYFQTQQAFHEVVMRRGHAGWVLRRRNRPPRLSSRDEDCIMVMLVGFCLFLTCTVWWRVISY